MRSISFFAAASLALSTVSGAPFQLPNGFPNPSPSTQKTIAMQAGGTLPNTPLPTSLSANAITTIQVLTVNEIFEVAYFSTLLSNITNGVKGFTDVPDKDYYISSLKQIIAQEEQHALGLNAILKSAGHSAVPSCNYHFPGVTTFSSALATAALFTDLVLGTLQTVQQSFALDGGVAASGLVPLVGSIIGQEGEQVGGFRSFARKTPSSAPFLTSSAGAFAFNAVGQLFVIPGSCPVLKNISVPMFETLTPTVANPAAKNCTLTFTTSSRSVSSSAYSLAYISGQNYPVVVPITSVTSQGSKGAQFKASFPFDSGFSKGLTIAALVKGRGPFANAAAVANATVAGPGLIEVD